MSLQLALLIAAIAGLVSIAIGLWFLGRWRRLLSSLRTRFGTRSKLFAAFLVVGVSLAGALALHAHVTRCNQDKPRGCFFRPYDGFYRRAAWQDPLAIVLVFSGVGSGVAIAVSALRRPRDN
jgi:hypothetical protein